MYGIHGVGQTFRNGRRGSGLDPDSQAAPAFAGSAGEVGLRVFGVVLWWGSITSVIGATYPSVTFIASRTGTSRRLRTILVVAFIAVTTLIFVVVGAAPTTLLILAGAFDGILLPLGISVMLWAAWRRGTCSTGTTTPLGSSGSRRAPHSSGFCLAVNSVRPVIDLFG